MFSLIRLALILLLNPWGLVCVGALIMSVAGMAFALGQMWVPPERAALSQVAGVLDRATKITRGRAPGVNYDLEIKSADGGAVKMTLPESYISEEQVKSLLGRPVVALFFGAPDATPKYVWELSSGGATIIPYEQVRRQRVESNAAVTQAMPYVGGFGLLVSLTGLLWLRRRRVAVAA